MEQNNKIRLDDIQEAIDDFRQGKMVIVVDDEDRENEGDLIVAAEKITPEQVNFMLKNARGVLCAANLNFPIRSRIIPQCSARLSPSPSTSSKGAAQV